MATTANQKPVKNSSAATGEKPSLLLFAGITLAGLLKDTLDFIGIGSLPGIGLVVTACFSFFSFVLLLLFDRSGGRGNKRMAQGMVVTMGTLVEGIGFVVNFLPLQTLTAVFLYLISYKSWKNSQRAAAVVMRRQRSSLQTQRSRMARAVALREERMAEEEAAASNAAGEPGVPLNSAPSVRAPRLQNFSVETARPQAVGTPAVAAGAGGRAMTPAMVSSRGEGAARPVSASSPSGTTQPVRPIVAPSFPVSQTTPTPSTLPVVKSDHGYAIDIGGGEIFGEYATQAEAERAMPEAVRSRDERAKYLRNSLAQSISSVTRPQTVGVTAPVSRPTPLRPSSTPPARPAATNVSVAPAAPILSAPKAASTPRTVPYQRIQDLSSDATARIRAAGSRLSQAFRPKAAAPPAAATGAAVLAGGLKGVSQGVAASGKSKVVPQPPVSTISKEQIFATRLDALLRNPTQHFDDSKMTEELFRKTPEYAELKRQGDQISTAIAQIDEIDAALRSYLSVKDSQHGMYGSGEHMSTGNQQVRVDAATRLHELSKKYESTFPYLKRYTDWKNINWANVARSLEVHRDSIGHYRQEKAKFDRTVSDARFKFNQGLTKEYMDWFKQQKITKRAA